ncbi:MAG: hypothetical protein JNK30_05775 [Phenylobacterium sp.]|uniref:hypothetical protein n=1 Tax=Phenylobacterium sp. TaxID=1871053 RepID=UPI001A44809B|nr:hypothetical protein [Phenylobacterium sp.]MBL8770872.1 hypothetical protein [Phenylobacterium sp.]
MIRRFVSPLAAVAVLAVASAAAAGDYIVVASTDPSLVRGQSLDAGGRVELAPGRTLTLMHASGDVLRLKGAPGGIVLPARKANQAEADRLAILKVMVAPAARQTVGSTRTRSGICPSPESLATLDAIVQVHAAGCASSAGEALESWLAAHAPAGS